MNDQTERRTPLVIAFVADLMVAVKIANAIKGLDYRVHFVGSAGEIAEPSELPNAVQAAEPVFGPEANLFQQITLWQPALLIFDLANEAIPWRQWLASLKSSPATRRIPVLCYAPHVEVEALQAARDRSAEVVVARGRFLGDLPGLIADTARRPDVDALRLACEQPPSELARRGVAEFNRGDYYEAHELLEEAWNEDDGAAREAYRGVLQVAVAYLQIERGNFQGAVKMFLRARQWLDPLPDVCREMDIGRLKSDAESVHRALLAAGPEGIADFDRDMFRPVVMVSAEG